MTQILEILIRPDGQTIVQTRGFAGPSCRQASAFLEAALGRPIDERPTAELFDAPPLAQRRSQST